MGAIRVKVVECDINKEFTVICVDKGVSRFMIT